MPRIKLFLKNNYLILLIFCVALSLRLYKLANLPFSFHQDEIMNGYVGRFIFLNNIDPNGNFWPLLFFDRFGDYPNVLPMYLSGLSTFIFGVNEFAVRFPIAFLGALGVIPVYLLSKMIFRKNNFIAPVIYALLPWHIILSRATSEGIIGLTVFTFAILFLLFFIDQKRYRQIFFAAILFLLSYFLYPSFRILAPLVLLGSIFTSKDARLKKILIILTIAFLSFTFYLSTTTWGKGRFLQTSLLHSKQVRESIQNTNIAYYYDEGQNNVLTARIFHNKYIGLAREIISQYLAYFSPGFLFLQGGLPSRYVVPGQGLIFISFLLALLLSVFSKEEHPKSVFYKFIVYLLLISPIPAALTIDDSPNVHRSVFMILPLVFITAEALIRISEIRLVRIRIIYPVLLLFLIEFLYFTHQYTVHTASYKSVYRNDGNKGIVKYLSEIKDNYEKIYLPFNNNLSLYYLFFTNNFGIKLAQAFRNDFLIDHLDNVYFVENFCPAQSVEFNQINRNSLFVNYGDCPSDSRFVEVKSIYRKDSTVAYRVLLKNEKN